MAWNLTMSFRDNFTNVYLPPPKTSHRERLKHALLTTWHDPTWDRINGCSKGKRCDSYYCHGCRTRLCKGHTRKVIKLHRSLHGNDDALARDNISFLTVLNNLAVIDPKGLGLYDDFSDVKRSVRSLKRKLARVRLKFPGLIMSGRVELEVVNVDYILNSGNCPKKTSVIKQMCKINKGHSAVMILVHAHLLLFLNGNDFDDVKSCVNERWPGKNMTRFQALHDNKSVEESLEKICFYSAKDRYHYNNKMDTDGYLYGRLFSSDVLSYIVRVSLSVGSSGFNVWSKRRNVLNTKHWEVCYDGL